MHVDKNVEQGLSKLKTAQNQNTRVIRTALENLRNKLKPGINHVSASKETQSAITQQLKLYHAYISKYTKVLDKISDCPFEVNSVDMPEEEDPYLSLIGEYLCRTARAKSLQCLVESGRYLMSPQDKAHLLSIHRALSSLRKGDVGPAEEWTRDFVLSLRAKGLPTYEADTLTFDLTVVHFLQLLSAGDPASDATALELAQAVFPYFTSLDETSAGASSGPSYCQQIGQLMSCMLFASAFGDISSPLPSCSSSSYVRDVSGTAVAMAPWAIVYPHLSVQGAIDRACEHLIDSAVKLHGLSEQSHLKTSISCGVEMMPSLRKGANLLAFTQAPSQPQRTQHSWSDFGTILLDYPEDKRKVFHSVFSCPVSREIASPGNSPVLLACGHAILRSSLKSLPKRAQRFKCPTCYHEQTGDGLELIF